MQDETNLIETSEVARRLKVSPSAISKMVKRGALTPAKKHNGVRGPFLFDPEHIQTKLEERAS